MHIEYKPLANVPTAETLGDTDTVLVVSAGEVKKTAKSNVGGGGSGGGLIVECDFEQKSQYEVGYTTDLDADDIVEAYKSGASVVFHFETSGGFGVGEQWMTLDGYTPADAENEVSEALWFSASDWTKFTTTTRTEDGKFFMEVYVD